VLPNLSLAQKVLPDKTITGTVTLEDHVTGKIVRVYLLDPDIAKYITDVKGTEK